MIHSVRCILSALRKDDLEPFVRLRTDADVMCYLGGQRDEVTERKNLDRLLGSDSKNPVWAIRSGEDSSFIGIITLTPHHDGEDIEISYLLLPEWWGQGYGTEAVRAIIDHGLNNLNLPRIVAETQTANTASVRLLKRVGMTLERKVMRFGAEQSVYTT